MLKKIFLLCILIAAMMSPSSWARLGESSDEADARYGTPLFTESVKGSNWIIKYYLKNIYMISITLGTDGKVHGISYGCPDLNNPVFAAALNEKNSKAITEVLKTVCRDLTYDELHYFLKVNSGGKQWDEILAGSVWRLPDSTVASYDSYTNQLAIYTKDLSDFISREREGNLSGL